MKWQQQAEFLWGERWKLTLARTSGYTKRTIQRWNSGEYKPDDRVIYALNATYEIWNKIKRK